MIHQNPEKLQKLKDALRLIMDGPGWGIVAEYEQELLKSLKDRDDSLSISHPHYERMKAYTQGQINGIKQLIFARQTIKDGNKNERRKANPTTGYSEVPDGFKS